MAKEVPTTTSFEDIYPADALPRQKKRWNSLLSTFEKQYGNKPDFISRSPGRVNIIGEHIDYSLYQVMPMAVTVDVLLAVSVTSTKSSSSSPRIRISNIHSAKFPSREFGIPADGLIDIDSKSHEWSNYFKAGLKGAAQLLQKKGKQVVMPSMDVMMDGTVPAGGGLSSSAAFVCASALAVMRASGEISVDKTELVELAVVSERAVGVNSGGMDQSASVFAQKDSALLVSFTPSLTASPVPFPTTGPPLVFVVAQSLVAADKHVTAPVCYNLRVVECTLAALVLAKILRLRSPLPTDAAPLGISLRGLHDAYFTQQQEQEQEQKQEQKQHQNQEQGTEASAEEFKKQCEELLRLAQDYLPQEEGYTREQISELVGTPVAELEERYMRKFPVKAERFMLRQRATHVFSETLRVQRALKLFDRSGSDGDGGGGGGANPARAHADKQRSGTQQEDRGNNKNDADNALHKSLGALLTETQTSCRDDYDCSCPELDELCAIASRAGSYGGRLTGAGWGGCSVHLVPEGKVDAVRAAWEREYYKKRWPEMSREELEDAVVVSRPGGGSCVYEVRASEVE